MDSYWVQSRCTILRTNLPPYAQNIFHLCEKLQWISLFPLAIFLFTNLQPRLFDIHRTKWTQPTLRTCCKLLHKLILSFRWRFEPQISRKHDASEIAIDDILNRWFCWINFRLVQLNKYSISFVFCSLVAVPPRF